MRERLYREMLRLRLVEETIATRYPEWKMRCPTHLSVGQEAAAVGVCAALRRDDYAFSTHRAHAHYLAKGGSLPGLVAELYGKQGGCARGWGGSMHLIDRSVGFLGAVPVVGSTIPIAVGAAFGSQLAGESRVTVCFLGDGATEEGVFSESLNFAALRKLPVVFACENNFYSVYSNLSVRQAPGRDLATLVRGHGVEYGEADGQDPVAVLGVTGPAVARARAGEGPTLLKFDTYRWREHCGPYYDDELGYRPAGELESWKQRCCVRRLEEALVADGSADPARIQGWHRELQEEIDAAFRFAEESPFPDAADLEGNVYATSVAAPGRRA